MTRVVMVVVYGKDSESALNSARKVVYEKFGISDEFNYYVDFARDDPLGLIHKSRWGPIEPVLQVSNDRFPTDDKRGLKMVNSAIGKNRKAFKKGMTNLRHLIGNYTNDELFDEVVPKFNREIGGMYPFQFRDYCRELSGYFPGPSSYLFDFRGYAIPNPRRLQCIMNDFESDPHCWRAFEGSDVDYDPWNLQKLWVVPFRALY
jgi:hypothetical protein